MYTVGIKSSDQRAKSQTGEMLKRSFESAKMLMKTQRAAHSLAGEILINYFEPQRQVLIINNGYLKKEQERSVIAKRVRKHYFKHRPRTRSRNSRN